MSLAVKGIRLETKYLRAALQALHQRVPYRIAMGGSSGDPDFSASSGNGGPCGPASGQESPGGNCASAPVSNASRNISRGCVLPWASNSRRSMTSTLALFRRCVSPVACPITRTTRRATSGTVSALSVVANIPLAST